MMESSRLKAFSDGVLAILITIMVLELRPPDVSSWQGLADLIPTLLSYILSYLYIGIYWNNHHLMLQACRRVTGGVLWANLHLLFWLSLLPFATAWLGKSHEYQLPNVFYGFILLAAAFAYYILEQVIIVADGPGSILRQAVGKDWKGKLSLFLYALAIGLSMVSVIPAQVLYAAVALLWLVPDRRIERSLREEV
jgi:uncharacterized membrane protein